MSSALYGATCIARDGRIVEIELESTGAIDPHFPLSVFFGFAVLHESASARGTRPGELARELTAEAMIQWSCGDSAERAAQTARYVVRAGYASTRHWQPSLCTPGPDGVYRVGVVPGTAETLAVQERLIAIAMGGTEPVATLQIEAADARWVNHLDVGARWDVYAFDDDAPLLM